MSQAAAISHRTARMWVATTNRGKAFWDVRYGPYSHAPADPNLDRCSSIGRLAVTGMWHKRRPYKCDGRVYRSQMTSCEEAEFFFANCRA